MLFFKQNLPRPSLFELKENVHTKAHKTLYDPDFYDICSHPSQCPPPVNNILDTLGVSLFPEYIKLTSPFQGLCIKMLGYTL